MKQMAQSIALPGKFAPVRYPSFPALERTAVMSFNATTSLTANSGTTKVLLTRQAAYPFWAEQTAVGCLGYGVVWLGQQKAPVAGAAVVEPIPGPYRHISQGVAYTATQETFGVSYSGGTPLSYPGNYPIIGIDQQVGGTEFIYVPANSTLFIVLARMVSGVWSGNFTLELWDSPGQHAQLYSSTFTSAGSFSVSPVGMSWPTNYWIRINSVSATLDGTNHEQFRMGLFVGSGTVTYTGSTTTMGTFALSASASGNFLLPRAGPTEFANSKLPWYSARTTAAAVLLTNTTKVMNKEGNVLWGRISPSVQNVWSVDSTYINTLHPAEKAFLPLECGTYSYCPPSTDMASFWDYSTNSAFALAVPVFRLDNDSMTNVGFLSDPDGATNLAMSVDWHIEFRTSSTLFQIGLSTAPIEALHSAQLALVQSGFFFDNFDHVAIIGKILRALGGLHPLISAMAPMAKGFLGTTQASSILSKQSRPPRATTAQRSGLSRTRRNPGSSQGVRLPPRVPRKKRTGTPARRGGTAPSAANSVANRMMGLNSAMRRAKLPI